jgi:hypothetical protein
MKQLLKSWLKWTWRGVLLTFITALALVCAIPFLWVASMIAEGDFAAIGIGPSGILATTAILALGAISLALFARVFTRIYPEFFSGKIDRVENVEPSGRGNSGPPLQF